MRRNATREIVFIVAAFTASWLTLADPCTAEVQPDRPIPAELKHAAPFVEFLRGAGLIVQEVQQSHLTGMFKGTDQAAYITTNRGVLELVTFPGSTDAERITIEYSKTPGIPASHHYRFRAGPSTTTRSNGLAPSRPISRCTRTGSSSLGSRSWTPS